MPKIIKVKESDIFKIANKVIKEQTEAMKGIGPYPPKVQQEVIAKPMEEKKPIKVYATSEEVTTAKVAVKQHITQALHNMKRLTKLTGVNPGIGKIVPGLENLLQKFDEIYGMPESESEPK